MVQTLTKYDQLNHYKRSSQITQIVLETTQYHQSKTLHSCRTALTYFQQINELIALKMHIHLYILPLEPLLDRQNVDILDTISTFNQCLMTSRF